MKWAFGLVVVIVWSAIALYDWPKMNRQLKREKIVYSILMILGGALAFMLIYNPKLPGPFHLFNTLFKPIVTNIEA